MSKFKKDEFKKVEVIKELEKNKESALDKLEKIKAEITLIENYIDITLKEVIN